MHAAAIARLRPNNDQIRRPVETWQLSAIRTFRILITYKEHPWRESRLRDIWSVQGSSYLHYFHLAGECCADTRSTHKVPSPSTPSKDSFTGLLICTPHSIGTGIKAKAQSKKMSMAEKAYERFVNITLSIHWPPPEEGVQEGSQAIESSKLAFIICREAHIQATPQVNYRECIVKFFNQKGPCFWRIRT